MSQYSIESNEGALIDPNRERSSDRSPHLGISFDYRAGGYGNLPT
jgi:hypothetical protein